MLAIEYRHNVAGTEPTGWVHVTNVWPSSIGVDLVESDSQRSASLDLSDSSSSKLVLGVLPNINVASQLCSSTFVDDVGTDLSVTDDGCVLLARRDGCAVSCECCVDLESNTVGEPAMPWTARMTPWALASDSKAALYNTDESISKKAGVQHETKNG
jgi:hypothetical protein